MRLLFISLSIHFCILSFLCVSVHAGDEEDAKKQRIIARQLRMDALREQGLSKEEIQQVEDARRKRVAARQFLAERKKHFLSMCKWTISLDGEIVGKRGEKDSPDSPDQSLENYIEGKSTGKHHLDIVFDRESVDLVPLIATKANNFAQKSRNSSCFIRGGVPSDTLFVFLKERITRQNERLRLMSMLSSVLSTGSDYFGCEATHIFKGDEAFFGKSGKAINNSWFLQHVEDDRVLEPGERPKPIQRFLNEMLKICKSYKYEKIQFYGVSMGGFASLMYGLNFHARLKELKNPPKVLIVADVPQINTAEYNSSMAQLIDVHLKDTFPKKLKLSHPFCVAILTGKIGCTDDALAKAFLKDVLPQLHGQPVHCIRMYSLISRHRTSTQSAKDVWPIFKALETLYNVQLMC